MTQDHPAVFGGVDTHKHTHVAAVLDGAGRVLGSAAFDADTAGSRRCWDGSAATAASSASAWREPAPTARASPGTSRLPASTSSM